MTDSPNSQPASFAARWAARNSDVPADLQVAIAAAADGIPYVVDADRLHELGLMEERTVKEDFAVCVVAEALEALLAVHGCDWSGPYLGDPEAGMGDYYLFERRKAA
jgi:hypothetical protein